MCQEPLDALGQCFRVLNTPAPEADISDAVAIAQVHFGLKVQAQPLSGERDRNFRLLCEGHPPLTLKLINGAEPVSETDMQVQVLHHLGQVQCPVAVPKPVSTRAGGQEFACQLRGQWLRGRAYTYLPGLSAVNAPASEPLRFAVGKTAAQLDIALRDFKHVAIDRVFPWNLMHLPVLSPLVQFVGEDPLRNFIGDFLAQYQSNYLPRLKALPQQVIHGDLSKSNLLVSPTDLSQIHGVLDFGDMVHGPAIADLAVAASYYMGEHADPEVALAQVQTGYESECPLSSEEKSLLAVLVMGRLVQRILIPEWRAAQFPENHEYILRSNAAARVLLQKLVPVWASHGQIKV